MSTVVENTMTESNKGNKGLLHLILPGYNVSAGSHNRNPSWEEPESKNQGRGPGGGAAQWLAAVPCSATCGLLRSSTAHKGLGPPTMIINMGKSI